MSQNYLNKLNVEKIQSLSEYTVGITAGAILRHFEQLDYSFITDYLTSNERVSPGEMVIHLSVTNGEEPLCDGVILKSDWPTGGKTSRMPWEDTAQVLRNHIARMTQSGYVSYEVAHATVLTELIAIWVEAWKDLRDIPPCEENDQLIADLQFQIHTLENLIREVVLRLSFLVGGILNTVLKQEPTGIPVFILTVDLADKVRKLAFRPWVTKDFRNQSIRKTLLSRIRDRIIHAQCLTFKLLKRFQ